MKEPDFGLAALVPDPAAWLDCLPFYAFVLDRRHRVLHANRAVLEDLGLPADELLGACCQHAVHGRADPPAGCPLEEVLVTGRPAERVLQDERTGRWLLASVYPTALRTPDGEAIFLHFVRDVTRARQAEIDAARERDTHRILADILEVALSDAALDEVFRVVLARILELPWVTVEKRGGIFLLEGTPPALVLKTHHDFPPWAVEACGRVPLGECLCGQAAASGRLEFADEVDERHRRCHDGLPPHGHYCVPVVSRGRVLGIINLYLREHHGRDGREELFLRTVADVLAGIIERRRTEEHLRRSQKMEALGQLAASVAHDFNNLLQVIGGYASVLRAGLPEVGPEARAAVAIESVVGRASAITRQLLAFSRQQPAHPEVLRLDELIRDVLQLVGPGLGAGVEVEVTVHDGVGPVRADRMQLEQVLVNLVINARDAMPQGGRLRLVVGDATIGAGHDAEVLGAAAGRYSTITVSDTGVGMPPEVRDRVFEPFFTTKRPGKGTGLGLAIVYGIVRHAGGFVRVDTAPGAGTSFVVGLPYAPEPAC